MAEFLVRRASLVELRAALAIVGEYYEAARVLARETATEFVQAYFADHTGFWLAWEGHSPIGCVALRSLPVIPASGEIKRLYVRPPHRKAGVAQALICALESHAAAHHYEWLYLDSAAGMEDAVRFYRRNGFNDCQPYNHNPQAVYFLRKRLPARRGTLQHG